MAVVSVNETWDGRSGDAQGIGKSRMRRSFLARTNSKLDSPQTVLSSGMVPVAYVSTHPSNPFFLCRRVSATQKSESPFAWDIEAEYSDEPLGEEEDQEENPLDRPPIISWSSAQYQKAIAKDINDEAILNSAGDPFDPPPAIDDARWVVSVTKNVASVPAAILNYNNRINSAAITVDGITFPKHTAKVQAIRISEVKTENEVSFRTFSYELHYRAETWVLKPLDAGFQYLDSGEKKEITNDGDGAKPTTPQLLDGSGGILASPSPSTAVFLEFDVYDETDLTVLPGVS